MENSFTIAVADDGACGSSPVMPYVGERYGGATFTALCKRFLAAALLRCGFDVFDGGTLRGDGVQDLVMRVNRHGADALVILSYAAFGSRKSFNDVNGYVVRFSSGRFGGRSRVLCEDICAKLALGGRTGCMGIGASLDALACPAATVDAGYMTHFDDAKLIFDPDFALNTAEHIAMGACENSGVPYVTRDDVFSYPLLGIGRRGKKVKMLQYMLAANGIAVTPDGVLGAETEKAVKAFRERNGGESGSAATELWCDLMHTGFPELAEGSSHSYVLYIQRKLRSKLYPAPTDGVMDARTISCFCDFLTDETGEQFDGDVFGEDEIKLLSPVGGGKPRLF